MSNHAVHLSRLVPDHLVERLHAAAGELSAATLDDLGMHEIARITGIPRATLYYHFSNKDDLVTFLLRAMLEDLRLAVFTALDRGGDVGERVRAVLQAQFQHLAANPALSRLLLVNLGKVERLRLLGDGVEAGFRMPVRRLLDEAVVAGEVDAIDTEVFATALYGAVTFLGLESLLRRGAINAPALTDSLFRLFWIGVGRSLY